MEDCEQITPDFMQSLSRGQRFRNSVARLFSRLL
jgi:hypothetical protein